MVFDSHVSDLLPECGSARSLVRLGDDGFRNLTPFALTAHVLTFDTELILEAFNQACDLIVGLCNLLGSY